MSKENRYENIWSDLQDIEYRKEFIEEFINVGIAFQIRGLRNKKKMNQVDLAKLIGVKQPQVSAWENPNYGNYSLNTLKDIAKAFDVGLLVRFVPFSTLANWTLNVTANSIAPSSFSEENSKTKPVISLESNLEDLRNTDSNKSSDSGTMMPAPTTATAEPITA